MNLPERYNGRPLLILLENYALSAIGAISAEKERQVAASTQRVFGGGDDWRLTLRNVLNLDGSLDDAIRDLGEKNQKIALKAGEKLEPADFARMFADANFAHLF